MRHGQCITCGKTKTQFVKRGPAGGSFLNTFVKNLPYEMTHDLCNSKHDDTKTRNEVCDKTMLDG